MVIYIANMGNMGLRPGLITMTDKLNPDDIHAIIDMAEREILKLEKSCESLPKKCFTRGFYQGQIKAHKDNIKYFKELLPIRSTIEYIDTCPRQFLTDHHDRDGESLVSIYPQENLTKEDIIDDIAQCLDTIDTCIIPAPDLRIDDIEDIGEFVDGILATNEQLIEQWEIDGPFDTDNNIMHWAVIRWDSE